MSIIPNYKGCVLLEDAKHLIAVEIGPKGSKKIVEAKTPRNAKASLRNPKRVLSGIDPAEHTPGTILFREEKGGAVDYLGHLSFPPGEAPEELYECQNCGLLYTDTDGLREVEDFFQRVAPGEVVPFGECNACGAVVHQLRETPTAMVVVQGGLVQEVLSDAPVRVIVKDLDTDFAGEDVVATDPDGARCVYAEFDAEVSPEAMRKNRAAAAALDEG